MFITYRKTTKCNIFASQNSLDMSLFQIPIPKNVRQSMTIQPPLPHTEDGVLLYPSDSEIQRYEDYRQMKQRVTVRIEEEADERNWEPGKHCRYILGVVCMSSDADLLVILAAARHLGLISRYEIIRKYKEELDERYEKNFIEVSVESGYTDIQIGIDTYDNSPVVNEVPVMISLEERKHVWLGLFEAAGYKVKWGGTLNVRKTHI